MTSENNDFLRQLKETRMLRYKENSILAKLATWAVSDIDSEGKVLEPGAAVAGLGLRNCIAQCFGKALGVTLHMPPEVFLDSCVAMPEWREEVKVQLSDAIQILELAHLHHLLGQYCDQSVLFPFRVEFESKSGQRLNVDCTAALRFQLEQVLKTATAHLEETTGARADPLGSLSIMRLRLNWIHRHEAAMAEEEAKSTVITPVKKSHLSLVK